jgi:hypothetical protein
VAEGTRAWVCEYAMVCARNADFGSEFERLLRPHRNRSDDQLLRMLLFTGYDGLVLSCENKVLGHVWYQRRGDELRVFSVWIAEKYRRALREKAVLGVIERARQMPGVKRVQIGTEMHSKVVSWVLDWLARKYGDLGIAGHRNGVVYLQ